MESEHSKGKKIRILLSHYFRGLKKKKKQCHTYNHPIIFFHVYYWTSFDVQGRHNFETRSQKGSKACFFVSKFVIKFWFFVIFILVGMVFSVTIHVVQKKFPKKSGGYLLGLRVSLFSLFFLFSIFGSPSTDKKKSKFPNNLNFCKIHTPFFLLLFLTFFHEENRSQK